MLTLNHLPYVYICIFDYSHKITQFVEIWVRNCYISTDNLLPIGNNKISYSINRVLLLLTRMHCMNLNF